MKSGSNVGCHAAISPVLTMRANARAKLPQVAATVAPALRPVIEGGWAMDTKSHTTMDTCEIPAGVFSAQHRAAHRHDGLHRDGRDALREARGRERGFARKNPHVPRLTVEIAVLSRRITQQEGPNEVLKSEVASTAELNSEIRRLRVGRCSRRTR
jgi:hypothetical protein